MKAFLAAAKAKALALLSLYWKPACIGVAVGLVLAKCVG